jgi:hypothetical protein
LGVDIRKNGFNNDFFAAKSRDNDAFAASPQGNA